MIRASPLVPLALMAPLRSVNLVHKANFNFYLGLSAFSNALKVHQLTLLQKSVRGVQRDVYNANQLITQFV